MALVRVRRAWRSVWFCDESQCCVPAVGVECQAGRVGELAETGQGHIGRSRVVERDEYPGEREPGLAAYRIDTEAIDVAGHGGNGLQRKAALVYQLQVDRLEAVVHVVVDTGFSRFPEGSAC